jgi:exosortase
MFVVGYGPLLLRFFANLWRFEVFRFFPMALLGAVILAWRGLGETRRPIQAGSSGVSLPLMVLSLALLASASLLWSPWLGVAAALTALPAAGWWLGGRPFCRALLPAWIMLFTVIPPPLRLDARLALALQQAAVAGSSRVLDLMAVPHLRSGNILDIPGQRLLVEEACSGINSVLFMSAACVFYVLWRRRSLLFLVPLYVMTIGAVLFGNLIRITSGAWLLFNFHIDLFSGWRHESLGLVLTALYLGFIVGADALMTKVPALAKRFAPPAPVIPPDAGVRSLDDLFAGRKLTPGLLAVASLLVLLGLLELFQAWHYSTKAIHERRINPAGMDGSAKFSLPSEIDLWKLRSEEKPVAKKTAFEDGVYSHIWQYERDGLIVTVSLDYPFFDYHDVRVCYSGSGWTIEESKLQSADPMVGTIPAMEVALFRENGLKATLLYSTVDQGGKWLDESDRRTIYDAHGRSFEGGLLNRITARLQGPLVTESGSVNYRIQVLATAHGGLDSQQLAQVRSFFGKVRSLLADQFVVHPKESPANPAVRIISEDATSAPPIAKP